MIKTGLLLVNNYFNINKLLFFLSLLSAREFQVEGILQAKQLANQLYPILSNFHSFLKSLLISIHKIFSQSQQMNKRFWVP